MIINNNWKFVTNLNKKQQQNESIFFSIVNKYGKDF